MPTKNLILAAAVVFAISTQPAQAFDIPRDNSDNSSSSSFSSGGGSDFASSFGSAKKGNFVENAKALGNELVANASAQLYLFKDEVLDGVRKIGASIK